MFEKINDFFSNYGLLYLNALLIFIGGIILSKLILKITEKTLKKSHLDYTAHAFLLSLLKTVLYTLTGIIVLSKLNIPMTSIIAVLSAAGLTISLALKENLSNVASGFILMFSRPFKVDDFIKVKDTEGTVKEITILYTKLLTIDNRAVMIPNSIVTNNIIINNTSEDTRRLELKIPISYHSDFKKAKKTILDTIYADKRSLCKPDKPFAVMYEHSSDSIIIMARVWVKQNDYWELRYSLLENIKKKFDIIGIIIPYNQLDVHITN